MAAPSARPRRATVDTNLFVSALISRGAPHLLLQEWRRGSFVLVVSARVVAEMGRVLRRSYFRDVHGLAEAEIRVLEERIHNAGELVEHLNDLPEGLRVRDPKDEHVLQTALTGNADYLVTGDHDLLSLRGNTALGKLKIVTVNEFLDRRTRVNQ